MDEHDFLLPRDESRQRAPQQRAIDKISSIIEATIALLERDGEAAVRIADICRETGVSYGTIYHHFGDRDGLIRAAQFTRLRRQPSADIDAFGAAAATIDTTDDFIGAIVAICTNMAAANRGPVRLVRTSVLASTVGRPDLTSPVVDLENQIMEDLVAVIERAQASGMADPNVDPLALAAYLSAVSYGLVLTEFWHRRPDPELLADVLLRAFAAFMPQA